MKQMGIPGKTASLMSEMNEAANDGRLKPLEERSEKNTTGTAIEDWGREVFAPAYNAKAAGAYSCDMGVWRTSISPTTRRATCAGTIATWWVMGIAGHEATDKILREYYSQEESEMGVVWLALAATQWNCGRLEERVKAKALKIIESGSDLKRWIDRALERKRGTALSKLREQLLSPQPAAKRIPKPFRSTCDWELGELIAYRLIYGKWIVFRVTDFSEDKFGVYPQCEILGWIGDAVPAARQLDGLSIRIGNGHIKRRQVSIGCASSREFPALRLAKLNAKLEPSETSKIKIRHPGGPIGFKGGGLLFALWRTFDQHLETYYGLR